MNALTFYDLIHRQYWLSIETALIRLYPDVENQIESYLKVFDKLRTTSAQTSDTTLRLTEIIDDDEAYVDVDGYYTDGRIDKYSGNDALALDFTPWDEWLGMPIDTESLKEFTEQEIIVHSLFEMTFHGFNEDEIQAQMDELKRSIEEYEKMTPEERKRNTSSIDELLEGMNED